MKLKRILSGLIGLPIVALILIYGNIYVIDVLFTLVALISIHEYFNSFKEKHKPIKWLRIYIMYINCVITYNSCTILFTYFSISDMCKYSNIIYTWLA